MVSPEAALWFAIQVMPQHECKVSTLLRFKGQEQFLPMVSTRRRWSDRVKVVDSPLFPGYVFCRTKRSCFGTVLSTPGVHRIVSFCGQPQPIADHEIDFLHQVLKSGRDVTPVPYLSLGQKVKVINGPLFGLSGIVNRLKNRDRLIISVDMLMRSVAVEVGIAELGLSLSEIASVSDSPALAG